MARSRAHQVLTEDEESLRVVRDLRRLLSAVTGRELRPGINRATSAQLLAVRASLDKALVDAIAWRTARLTVIYDTDRP